MKRFTTLTVAVITACGGLVLTTGPTLAGTASRSTSFAFQASGYGTRLIGGQVPAGSSTTGYQHIGCTNRAGLSRVNHLAKAAVPGLGRARGIRTHAWTTSRRGVLASHSTHRIAELTLARSPLGSVSLDAITSRATAYHDSRGFHATTATHLGGLTFTPPTGPTQSLAAPTPDHPVTVPGLVTVYAGKHTTRRSHDGAVADAFALRVDVLASGTSVRVAHSHAELHRGLTGGVFAGHSAATHVVTAAGDIVRSGPNPLTLMPCQGTYGRSRAKSLASIDLGGQLVVTGASSAERGIQHAGRAHGVSRAHVVRVDLGGGQVVVTGILGKASVARVGHHVTRSTKGTVLGSVTVAGRRETFPKTGVLQIPGVAKLERGVVHRTHGGISVIGLRITLLDGSGAVVNLAEAALRIRPLT